MNILSYRDAFSYHSTFTMGEKAVSEAKKFADEAIIIPPILGIPGLDTQELTIKPSAFVTIKTVEDNLMRFKLSIKKITVLSNLVKALSYLPIIGTIVGIAGLILLSKYEKKALNAVRNSPKTQEDLKCLFRGLKFRLGVATTSLGIALAVPDLIYSLRSKPSKSS